ncbi:hypothetical protein [Paractinoplanes rishiriensis]|uniref:Uncharacterized protein n=1 Tax=Paractinoplanes rishiriensis TaxID=1050105 RepID=A0A919MSJ8_9ACTN|nr:hypothetical protein [Actinoplanes rishiriensis]GIE98271.1 hypothetical protein Ari01nite_57360 [Actinoplanes rishiriensis]
MTETGWPLIPREVLPAPVPAARRRLPARPPTTAELGRQLPFFGAETTEPAPSDLVGLLAGPGRLGRMGGTARVSIEVDAAWRVHVLVAELVVRGLVASWRPIEVSPVADDPETSAPGESESSAGRPIPVQGDLSPPDPRVNDPSDQHVNDPSDQLVVEDDSEKGTISHQPHFEVLTAYSSRLNGLARGWPQAAAQLFLSGPRLRLWVAAAGTPVAAGYALGLDPDKDPAAIDAALVRAGLAGNLSDGGRRYLIVGKRRLRRLAELVGERPAAAPAQMWPGGAAA